MPDVLPFTLTNAADGSPALTAATDTTMKLAVANRLGADIALVSGKDAAQLVLSLPGKFFTPGQLTAMVPTGQGWDGSAAATGTVTFTCASDRTWAQGETLTFTIAGMRSDAAPGTAPIYLRPLVPGNVPAFVPSTLTLKSKSSGRLTLPLAAILSGGGVIYRSSPSDPLVNSLVLTVKNTSAAPICTAKQPAGKPRIIVSFVYGTSAGALAPSSWPPNVSPPADSAWKIHARPAVAETHWQVADPPPAHAGDPPAWTLTPAAGNDSLFGRADSDTANFSAEFSEIRSFTEPGHTQMIVLCTGFMQDAQTPYEDLVLVLDLDKTDPPATRGLVAFSASEPVVTVTTPHTVLPLSLRWTMYGGVAKVRLITSEPTVPPWERSYAEPASLATDHREHHVPAPAQGGAVFATLQAFDGSGTFLNQAQFTVVAQAMYVTDKVGTVYPVKRYGSTLWMTADYRYDSTAGSSAYPGQLAGPAGRLYAWDTALAKAPAGWDLPTAADWDALTSDPAWQAAPYDALINGGAAGFDAVLGGLCFPSDNLPFQDQDAVGYYWTATAEQAMQFLAHSHLIRALDTPADPSAQLAVRYVRRL